MSTLHERIREHPFFLGLTPDHVDILVAHAREVKFMADEILFREGEPANQFYLIESGRIVLEAHRPADGNAVVQTLRPGDVLGWSWLFPPFSWHFQARALEPTTAIVLDGAQLLVAGEQNREFGYELMQRITHVIIRRLQATRKQWLEQPIELMNDG